MDRVLREGGHTGARVTAVTPEPLASSGATTEMARLRLEYADGEPGPASLVGKLRGQDDLRRQIDAAMGLFDREVRFYRGLAGDLPVDTAAVFHTGDGHQTPLLLEDLAGLRLGDQAAGLSVSDAEQCLDALAALHAAYWQSPTLQTPWLTNPCEGMFRQMTAQLMVSGVGALDAYASSGQRGQIPTDPARWEKLIARLGDGPHTLVHNDCRLDNIFFRHDGRPVVVDWQTLATARASMDVANLLGGSMEPDDLSTNWERLLRRYHDGLVQGGVEGYSFDELLLHYRQNLIWPLGQGLALIGALKTNDTRGVGPKNVMRALAHVAELDAFAAHTEA
ncbi:hypothetical protein BKN37_00230 [Mycobacterium talmoniae]|uniref:CHK kinase-like domain-containing protein n=1 Tax=Mycobacterium talmoniae TaxID=1858794 RepID=A0A1S1NR16_9MYCO|nr:hypothetical protein BKN37_00230 [Mycobacterium talmoniae]